jgi:hypothetical protein
MTTVRSPLPLGSLQRAMIDALYGSSSDARLYAAIRVRAGLTPESLLGIYRGGTQETLIQALRIAYPVVERLVGVDFFAATAAAYISEIPARSGDLEQYGADFAPFIESYDPAATLPYLGDVARLEWIVSRLQRAPSVPALDREQLVAVSGDKLVDLRLELAPHAALFSSCSPAYRIWQENHDRSREPRAISLTEGAEQLLLIASEGIEAWTLNAPEYAFFSCCRRGTTLAEALGEALCQDSAFDLAATLARTIEWRCLALQTLDSGPWSRD